MDYVIREIKALERSGLAEPFEIRHYGWGFPFAPRAAGALAFVKGMGFHFEMRCFESGPVRVQTQNDAPVYTDSAMELFLNCYPDDPGSGYLNFEVNANGAILSEYGRGKKDRVFLAERELKAPKPGITVTEESWTVEFLIPLELIGQIYGKSDFERGSVLTGNFFKVGENEILPHYGSFMPIFSEEPEFHLPQFFGRFIIS